MMPLKRLIKTVAWIRLHHESYVSTSTYHLGRTRLFVCHVHTIFFFAVPISNVTMWANATDLVEFNDTAVLKCSALIGSHLSYTWLKGGSVVTKGQLSDGGATLTIVGVTRYDNGWYSCNVSNGVSHECSLPLYLNISCEFVLEIYFIYSKYMLYIGPSQRQPI